MLPEPNDHVPASSAERARLPIVHEGGALPVLLPHHPPPQSASAAPSFYSSIEPNLLTTSHEVYHMVRPPQLRRERRYPRVTCVNVKACIRTEQGKHDIVDLLNVSRGGACVRSHAEYPTGTAVKIATHYMHGSHNNIFQNAHIIRIQHKPTPTLAGEYGIEFCE